MAKEDIVLSHKISRKGIQVDQAKVEVIAKFPPPITVRRVEVSLGMPSSICDLLRTSLKSSSNMQTP